MKRVYLIILIVLLAGVSLTVLLVVLFNNNASSSCTVDSDCKFVYTDCAIPECFNSDSLEFKNAVNNCSITLDEGYRYSCKCVNYRCVNVTKGIPTNNTVRIETQAEREIKCNIITGRLRTNGYINLTKCSDIVNDSFFNYYLINCTISAYSFNVTNMTACRFDFNTVSNELSIIDALNNSEKFSI